VSVSAPLTVREVLEQRAHRRPTDPAIAVPGGGQTDNAALFACVQRISRQLHTFGISKNACLAVVAQNGAELALAILAISAGTTVAPLSPGFRRTEFLSFLSDLKPSAVLVQRGLNSPALAVARDLDIPVIEFSSDAGQGLELVFPQTPFSSPVGEADFPASEDGALMLQTAGTTGEPKFVPITQGNLVRFANTISRSLALTSSDRCLNVMPLFHAHGLIAALMASMVSGGSIFCTHGFQAENVLEWMKECGPTWYTAVPSIHQAILACVARRDGRIAGRSLRFLRSCSGPLSPELTSQMEGTFGVPIINCYPLPDTVR
jgi:acyl-CoA synthetase (AMP-forming)/AMP-acid ligase II